MNNGRTLANLSKSQNSNRVDRRQNKRTGIIDIAVIQSLNYKGMLTFSNTARSDECHYNRQLSNVCGSQSKCFG
jgi:hypothetical protein